MLRQDADTMQIMHFKLPGMIASIDLQYLVKVILLPALEPVPHHPAWFAGLMNYAGQSVAVVDLAMRLNLPRKKKYTLETPILLCESEAGLMGFIVDEVIQISKIKKEDIQHDSLQDDEKSILSGTVLLNNKLSQLLNIQNMMATMDEIIP